VKPPGPVEEWRRDGYVVSTDTDRLDLDVVHGFLATSYWASARTRDDQRRTIDGSRCFGLYHEATGAQVGFTRVVTDGVTFAWIADVFVLDAHRGKGLGKFVVGCAIDAHRDVRRLVLGTRDAHGLYAQFGFTPLTKPERWMERFSPGPEGPG
jgi:GNAT superfamily N-acetyltransferase